jgi:two-component system CitB family sensor kinase
MLEGELYTVLLNILSNAIKATVASRGEGRSIRFEAIQNGRRVRMRILDNGIGLSPAFYEDAFTPFIADPSGELYDMLQERAKPEDLAVFGTGSGLGLAIARDVARSRGGDIRFVSASSPWKTCVEVDLP